MQGVARKLGFYEVTAGDLAFEEQYHQQVARTTNAEIREAAARYLNNENLTAVSLVPGSITTEAVPTSLLQKFIHRIARPPSIFAADEFQ